MLSIYNSATSLALENEVDGVGFFDLDDSDIKSLGLKLGTVKKILRLQRLVRGHSYYLNNMK